ncbi:hypothetical protein BDW72DRAFT_166369 [Aspergillus terricola var. indicus]
MDTTQLPPSTSPTLTLAHPTPAETQQIWAQTSALWTDALTVPQYLEEYAYLLTVPLARDHGITQWILVDSLDNPTEPVDDLDRREGTRTVLASCETFRKRALLANRLACDDFEKGCTNTLVHGVASVFCDPQLRGRGYASRLLKELSHILPRWQADEVEKARSVGSVLYSDIDPAFYKRLGWAPYPSYHLEFQPAQLDHAAEPLYAENLAALCRRDEEILRASMSSPSTTGDGGRTRFAIIPDHDHMLWHHAKEEFGARKLFGGSKKPEIKGAIAGPAGNRVWAIWTHRFYRHPHSADSAANTLYILRLVAETSSPTSESMEAVLHAARSEAASWGLGKVKLWNPPRDLEEAIRASGVNFEKKKREHDSVPCLNWFGEESPDEVEWVLNEKYAWC